MQLSKEALAQIPAQPGLTIPDVKLLELPEKVLQTAPTQIPIANNTSFIS